MREEKLEASAMKKVGSTPRGAYPIWYRKAKKRRWERGKLRR
jgi:hypothetical protein